MCNLMATDLRFAQRGNDFCFFWFGFVLKFGFLVFQFALGAWRDRGLGGGVGHKYVVHGSMRDTRSRATRDNI